MAWYTPAIAVREGRSTWMPGQASASENEIVHNPNLMQKHSTKTGTREESLANLRS
jgi:hypothetical protein